MKRWMLFILVVTLLSMPAMGTRFFIARNGASVIERQVMAGDDAKIDAIVAKYRTDHPTLTLTETDQATYDATPMDPAPITAALRSSATDYFLNDAAPISKVERAAAFVTMDEINILRQRDRDRAADVAAATTFADLKTRWAARSSLDDRVPSQIRTAIQNKINSGAAD